MALSDQKLQFAPSEKAETIMRDGEIIADDESPDDMVDRISGVVADIEDAMGGNRTFARRIESLIRQRRIVPSTPILTNAGRFENRPLSACSVPPVDFQRDVESVKQTVDTYHEEGMGTGFNLDEAEKPIETLEFLNKIAVEGFQTDKQHRPVGNMAIMRVDNPAIKEFVEIKRESGDKDWKFNLSVNVTDEFMQCYYDDIPFELTNGEEVDAGELMDIIVECAWDCADPGLIFLGNMNQRRPFHNSLEYVSVAPCAEVGLARGETCQFSSINIVEFVDGDGIDYDELDRVVGVTTRFLDDVLQYSIEHYSYEESKNAMERSRKIGIGFCGYSELLTRLGLRYGSTEANELLRDTLSFINYKSKLYSSKLAEERGSFGAFDVSKYNGPEDFLTEKFGEYASNTVSKSDWQELDRRITERGIRNSTTVILPPTGRSAMVFDTSQSIEPIFSLSDRFGNVNRQFRRAVEDADLSEKARRRVLEHVTEVGSCQDLDLPEELKAVFRTAVEIDHGEHFDVLLEAQKFVDEAVSKTINLPRDATREDVRDVYCRAYEDGLNGMTVYRSGSSEEQPMDLKGETDG